MPLQQTLCVPGTTCSELPLEKRKVIKKIIASAIVYVVLWTLIISFTAGVAYKAIGDRRVLYLNLATALVIIGLGIIYAIIREVYYFKNYFYDLKNDEIIIRKGFIARTELSLTYNKIQNIYVDQDWLDRFFGLYDVHLETAGGSSGVEAHIDGVNAANAAKLRAVLMEKSKQAPNQTRVGV